MAWSYIATQPTLNLCVRTDLYMFQVWNTTHLLSICSRFGGQARLFPCDELIDMKTMTDTLHVNCNTHLSQKTMCNSSVHLGFLKFLREKSKLMHKRNRKPTGPVFVNTNTFRSHKQWSPAIWTNRGAVTCAKG